MEAYEIELIEKHLVDDSRLAKLYKEHKDFEVKLEEYNNKSYLTPEDEIERKNLQKLKLMGRDEIEKILVNYRKGE